MEEARKSVDASEMAAMPHCQLEPVGADAGTVYFCQPKSIAIILRNTGEVWVCEEVLKWQCPRESLTNDCSSLTRTCCFHVRD